jgi:hypothetical protein
VVGVLDVVLETFDLTFGRTDVTHSFSHKVDDRVAVDTIQMYSGGSASALLTKKLFPLARQLGCIPYDLLAQKIVINFLEERLLDIELISVSANVYDLTDRNTLVELFLNG